MADPFILRERFQGKQSSSLSSASIVTGLGAAVPGSGAAQAGAELQGASDRLLSLFVKQRNSLIHQMTDTTFDKEKLLEFRNVVTNFLMDLQYFMHAFGELIEKDAREGELSDDEKMQLK